MDFFTSQDQARKRTSLLVVLYGLTVLLITAAIYGAVFVTLHLTELRTQWMKDNEQIWFDPQVSFAVLASSIILILGGSLTRVMSLRKGGPAVAEMLGGRIVTGEESDPALRRLSNLVEEMAIASGLPVPPVYLLPNEKGINAFAAGFTVHDAAVGVTQGAVDLLSRDELQGVIAHEFSHILNGDMRLNIRLLGLLNGILMFYVLGWIIVRTVGRAAFYSGGGSSRRSSRDNGGGGAVIFAIILIGAALVIIGSIGVLFSRLIQAAISRQREYLADAAAVQFTRNPQGIAGALKKIGGITGGSRLESGHAEEVGHMFFSRVSNFNFGILTATHPPLRQRIRAIDPTFDGKYPRITPKERAAQPPSEGYRQPPPMPKPAQSPLGQAIPIRPEIIMASIGLLEQSQLAKAREQLDKLPRQIRQSAHDITGARALLYLVLFHPEGEHRESQLSLLQQHADPLVLKELIKLLPYWEAIPSAARLTVVDLALPVLRQLSPAQWERVQKNLDRLIEADDHLSLFEFGVRQIIRQNLGQHFAGQGPKVARFHGINALLPEISILLSALSHLGEKDTKKAFGAALGRSGSLRDQLVLFAAEDCSLEKTAEALEKIADSTLPIRQRVLDWCVFAVASDHQVDPEEAVLLRAIAESFSLPLPPIL